MSFEDFKRGAALLSSEDRRKLTAFLIGLEERQKPDYQSELAAKIEDKDLNNWASLEELDSRIGLNKE